MQASTFLPFTNVASADANRNPIGRTGQSGARGPGGTGRAATYREPQGKSFAKSLENAARKAASASDEDAVNTVAAAAQSSEAGTYAGLVEIPAALLEALGLSGSGEIDVNGGPLAAVAPEMRQVLLQLLSQLRLDGQLTLTADSLRELKAFLQSGSELPADQFMEKLADILAKMGLRISGNPEELSGTRNGDIQAAMAGGITGNIGGPEAQKADGNDSAAGLSGLADNRPGTGKGPGANGQPAGNIEKAGGNTGAAAVNGTDKTAQRDINAAGGTGEADGAGEFRAEGVKAAGDRDRNSEQPGDDAFRQQEAIGPKTIANKAESGKEAEVHDSTRQEILPNDLLTRMSHTPVKDAGRVSPVYARFTDVIFGQIVQKAKLIELPGMAELQIRLKPDFLGRLNLSIITENGVITARFTAESYRVKEVIEANLNILKNALAEQGVKVDQLVVDVGTQRDYGAFREREAASYNRSAGRRGVAVAGDDAIQSLFEQASAGNAAADLYGSTVDLMA